MTRHITHYHKRTHSPICTCC